MQYTAICGRGIPESCDISGASTEPPPSPVNPATAPQAVHNNIPALRVRLSGCTFSLVVWCENPQRNASPTRTSANNISSTLSDSKKLAYTPACIPVAIPSDQSTSSLGFNKSEEQRSAEKTRKALAQFLRPEFLGRVDEVITFKPLSEETLQGIAALMLDEYKPGMDAKGIAYRYTPAALKALVKKSEGGKFGARDLRRVIRKAVEDPAAEKLIDGTLASGSTLVVDADENGEIVLN